MKKLFSLLIVALTATTSVFADDITVEQALQIAGQFANNPATQQLSKRRAPVAEITPMLAHTLKSKVADKDNAYVVNLGNNQGFVIVSGESGTGDNILGYCDHGSFSYEDCPVQLKDLLAFYTEAVDSLRQSSASASPRRAAQQWPSYIGAIVVGPLLTTTWDQGTPYNLHCPDGAFTGCYPTALAQVMYYWKWPKESIGKVDNEDFSGHVYDWDNMLDHYDIDWSTFTHYYYNDVQAEAVAKLMADIGKAFGTHYGESNGSPTYFESEPLINNFSYEPGITSVKGSNGGKITSSIMSELDKNRPVLYSGYPYNGDPHALVIDGYTTNNYFHFNYGWSGSYNGFYKCGFGNLYPNNVEIFTNVRPYDAVRKVIGDIEYGLLQNGEAHILDYTKKNVQNEVLEIPATVTGDDGKEYRVTHIRQSAFYQKGHFSKLVMGENIDAIDAFSFFYTNIDELVLSDKMEVVPVSAFLNTKVKTLTIGKNVKRIDKQAFYMCELSKVTSKSPAFEVGEEAFAHTYPDCGEWLGCITSIGKQAFFGAYFEENPYFSHVERIDDDAFLGSTWHKGSFRIPPTLKYISPTAISGAIKITSFSREYLSDVEIDEDNPYFSGGYGFIYNKNQSSLVFFAPIHQPGSLIKYPETMVKLERGSITSRPTSVRPYYYDVFIPASVIDMEGAFENCETLGGLTCLAAVPPAITDATFNDKIFENTPDIELHVPEGTEEMYANAPGWRKFPNIIGDQEYTPLPDQDREYYMVVNRTDNSRQQRVSMPISEVQSMSVSDDGTHVVICRNGKDDLTTSVVALDSISWAPGFVYEGAEVFELNDSTLTVEAQKCSVTFDATVIDDDVQLCVRNLVLEPQVNDDVISGFAVDLSLSDGTHELSGTADIVIPVSVGSNEKVQAAYYNEEKGQWEPVCFKYDKVSEKVTISTDHLSTFYVFNVSNDFTNKANIYFFNPICEYNKLNDATKILLDLVSSEDPDKEMVRKFKDDMALWQSVGLDGLYNAFTSVSEPLLNFKPEAIDHAVTAMGYVGTALSILDVVGADIRGDDVAVASGTLNTILNFASGQMAAAIGTPIMSASMGCVAFIGVALNKFGTMVQERMHDLAYNAYHYYYSKRGKMDADVKSNYRSPKDWYNYFYPAFAQGKMTKDKLDAYIEQSVRMYCDEIWNNYQAWVRCCEVAKVWTPGATVPGLTESLKEQLSNEHFAELMNGDLVSVFRGIKSHLKIEAQNRFVKALEDMGEIVNTEIVLRYKDSSQHGDELSKYAGWSVRLTDAQGIVPHPEQFACRIDDEGRSYQIVTIYSLLQNELRPHLTLADPNGVDKKAFEFEIPNGTDKVYVTIDLDKGGMAVDTRPLEGLELEYDPAVLTYEDALTGTPDGMYDGEGYIYLNNALNKRARFQTGVEQFLNRHDFITVDEFGNYKIGDDITGRFEENGLKATGVVTINVSHDFIEKTKHMYVQQIANPDDHFDWAYCLLDGTIQHQIECKYELTRESVDSKEFEVSYNGMGVYTMRAHYVYDVNGVDWQELVNNKGIEVTIMDITTRESTYDGTVTLKYATKLHD